MELGLKHNEVKIMPYDEEWKYEFNRVKQAILSVLEIDEKQIKHISSTVIEEYKAKPIIDILFGVEDISKVGKDVEKALCSVDFYRLRVERLNEIVFVKFLDETIETKTQFIHIVEYKGELWGKSFILSDHLNENKEAKPI